MKVLLIGLGFVGSHLAQWFTRRGDTVFGIDEKPLLLASLPELRFRQETGDLTDPDFMGRVGNEISTAGPFDLVVHSAGPNVWEYPATPLFESSLITRPFLSTVELFGASEAATLVLISSTEVRGGNHPNADPSDPSAPLSPFGASLAFCEIFGANYCRQREKSFVALRVPTLYGPREPDGSPFRTMFEYQYRLGESRKAGDSPGETGDPLPCLPIHGNPLRETDPLHIEDLAKLVLAVADGITKTSPNATSPGRNPANLAIHATTGVPTTNEKAAKLFGDLLGVTFESLFSYRKVTESSRFRLVHFEEFPRFSLAASEALKPNRRFEWEARIDLATGLAATIPHYVNDEGIREAGAAQAQGFPSPTEPPKASLAPMKTTKKTTRKKTA